MKRTAGNIISIACSFLCLTILLLLAGEISGLRQGLTGSILDPSIANFEPRIAYGGRNFYSTISSAYLKSALGMFFVFVAALLCSGLWDKLLGSIIPLLLIYQYCNVFEIKYDTLSLNPLSSTNTWIRSSLFFDWVCFCVFIAIFLVNGSSLIPRIIGKFRRSGHN